MSNRIPKIEIIDSAKHCQGYGATETFIIVIGKVNHFGKQLGGFFFFLIRLSIHHHRLCSSTPRYLSRRNGNICLHKDL